MEPKFTQGDVDRIVQDRLHRDRQARSVSDGVSVVSEPRVYALHSEHSYYADFRLATLRPREASAANERLARYAVELAHEIDRGSPEGQRAARAIRSNTRVSNPAAHERRYRQALNELRATTTGGGITASASGGGVAAFVTPYFLDSEWAMFRGIHRTFANQCLNLPLPPYGMQINVSTFSSASAALQKTEGSAVTETDPGSALQQATVVEITGQVTMSMAAHDRGWSGGGTFDALIHKQILQSLDQSVDSYALTQAIANAGVTTQNTPWGANTLGSFLTDLASAREGVTDTAGVRLWPTRLFSTSDFFDYVSHVITSANLPVLSNVASVSFPGIPMDGNRDLPSSQRQNDWSRFTGVVMPGALPWFLDDNIPGSGGTQNNTQVVVSAAQESLILLEDPDPILSVFEDSVAGNLQVILNAREYVALITRHQSGTQVITGTAYPSTNK